jgi:hypothetical protein
MESLRSPHSWALGYQIFRENGDNNEENINHGNHVI